MYEHDDLRRDSSGWIRVIRQDGPTMQDDGTVGDGVIRVFTVSPEFFQGGGGHMHFIIALHDNPPEIPPTWGFKSTGIKLTRSELLELRAAIDDFLEPPDVIAELREISADTAATPTASRAARPWPTPDQ